MSRFSSFLRQVDSSLNLPEAARARIIIEMHDDMEDLFQSLRDQGFEESEAERRTAEAFSMEPESLHELERIHQTFFRKVIYRASQGTRQLTERVLFYFFIGILTFLSLYNLSVLPPQAQHNKVVLGMFGIILAAFVFSMIKFYQLFIKKDLIIRKLKTGLLPLIYLAGMNLFIGIGGYYYHLYQSGVRGIIWESKLLILMTPGEHFQALEADFRQVNQIMIQVYSVMIVGLIGALLILLLWFFLLGRVTSLMNSEYRRLIS